MMLDGGAVPATLGYRGYTHSCCISINHVVCHGIPSDKRLKDGDIVNIDVTPLLDGWHGDTSRMYLVGDVPLKAKRLVEVTHECMMLGIEQARPGNRLGDIGAAIQAHAESQRYGVVREFCGHGLGRHRPRAAPRHVHDHRADDQPRQAVGEAAQRRLDRGDPRQEPERAVRALDRDYRGWVRDLYPEPDGAA
jgi:methionyl aminopeptidase